MCLSTSLTLPLPPPLYQSSYTHFRWDIIRRFNDSNSELKVVLLAIQSCGVGVDLPGGNHMFMLEPQESGADEEQAFDRHHRIGQTKAVYCWR